MRKWADGANGVSACNGDDGNDWNDGVDGGDGEKGVSVLWMERINFLLLISFACGPMLHPIFQFRVHQSHGNASWMRHLALSFVF